MEDSIYILKSLKAIDNLDKIRILNHLQTRGSTSCENISKSLKLTPSTSYKYLSKMKDAGIVSISKKSGKKGKLLYSINDIEIIINNSTINELFKTDEKKQLIIFDMDDTLIRRRDITEQLSFAGISAIREAQEIMSGYGTPITMPPEGLFSEDWIHSKYGNSIEWFISTWLAVAGVTADKTFHELVKKYVNRYYRKIEITGRSCEAFSDVKPFLEKKEYYHAIMSNSSRKAIMEILKQNSLLKYFIKDQKYLIVGGDEIPKSKETVKKLLKMAGMHPSEAILIGDTAGDIKAGRLAGINPVKTIAIDRGIVKQDQITCINPAVKRIRSLSGL